MKKGKILVILLCLVMLLPALAACGGGDDGGSSDPGAPATGGGAAPATGGGAAPATGGGGGDSAPAGDGGRDTVTIAVTTDLGTLAHENVSGDMYAACMLINEPLWLQGMMCDDDDLIWRLATSVDVHSPVHWTIHLREGVKFSNGNEFTAKDVLFSITTTRAGVNGAPRTQLMNLDNIIATDDYTIDWTWEAYHLGQWGIITDLAIYNEESYDADQASSAPIGTGPYVVKEYVVNSYCTLERRDDYWGELPEFKTIQFRVLTESSQVVNALETGIVDIAQRIDNADVEYVSALPGIDIVNRYDTNFAAMGFNTTPESPLHSREARWALCHAIDRQAIVNVVYSGRAVVLDRPNANTTMDDEPRYNNLHETYSIGYNVDLARQYAESSGIVGQTLRCLTNGLPEFVLMAEMVANMLQEIGVNVDIQTYDPATFTELTSRDPSAWDFRLSMGMNPGYKVASPMVMGVLYYPVMHFAGNWEGYEEYVQIASGYFGAFDRKERADITFALLETYTREALVYGICDIQTATAIASDLDWSSLHYRMNGNVLYSTLRTK